MKLPIGLPSILILTVTIVQVLKEAELRRNEGTEQANDEQNK